MSTRLNSLHPYPAMVADPLAEHLSNAFVSFGMRVLDPFCGTGRTLLAAGKMGARCIGVDVNPLASLLVKAKSAEYRLTEIYNLLNEIAEGATTNLASVEFDFERGRKVEWFSEKSKEELTYLIQLINSRKRSKSIKLLAGAVLSATVREVSYCRNNRWKLHRIPFVQRIQIRPSAISIFERRLSSVIDELQQYPSLLGDCSVFIGDTRKLAELLESKNEAEPFDLVITSPPYGDSFTTVQYGGMSGMCLGVVSYIKGLEYLRRVGSEIDANCLGGRLELKDEMLDSALSRFSSYWRGSAKNKDLLRVYQYLFDMEQACFQISSSLRKGGYAIIIVSRRRVGNWRLYLDRFVEDVFKNLGFNMEQKETRRISKKLLPKQVNRYARCKSVRDSKNNKIVTMSEEFILVLRKE